MKKVVSSKKRSVLFIVIITGLVLVGAFYIYKSNETKKLEIKINEYKSAITESYRLFDVEVSREKKLDIFKIMIQECNDYENGKDRQQEVYEEYQLKITDMRKCFIDDYQGIVLEHTIEDVEEEDNVESLNNNKEALSNLLKTIEEEGVATVEELNSYKENITMLIQFYDDRLNILAEEEVARKAAEEEVRQAEEERQRQLEQERNNNMNQNQSSSSGDVDNPNSGGHWYDDPSHYDRTYTNYDTGSTSYFCDHTGEAFDSEGNRWNFWEVLENL